MNTGIYQIEILWQWCNPFVIIYFLKNYKNYNQKYIKNYKRFPSKTFILKKKKRLINK